MTEEKRQEIITGIKEYQVGIDSGIFSKRNSEYEIETMMYELNCDEYITYSVYSRSDSGGECWMQVEYWSESLKKPIIMDYDWYSCFDSEQEMIDAIISMQEECEKLEKKLEVLR